MFWRLAAQVLGHLNQKRAANTRREEFYLQADAFAVLSEMDFVGIDGEQLSAAAIEKCFFATCDAMTCLAYCDEQNQHTLLAGPLK